MRLKRPQKHYEDKMLPPFFMTLKDYMERSNSQLAYYELIRNNAKLVNLDEIVGEIALEGALPYPPGIYCVVPGENQSHFF